MLVIMYCIYSDSKQKTKQKQKTIIWLLFYFIIVIGNERISFFFVKTNIYVNKIDISQHFIFSLEQQELNIR